MTCRNRAGILSRAVVTRALKGLRVYKHAQHLRLRREMSFNATVQSTFENDSFACCRTTQSFEGWLDVCCYFFPLPSRSWLIADCKSESLRTARCSITHDVVVSNCFFFFLGLPTLFSLALLILVAFLSFCLSFLAQRTVTSV